MARIQPESVTITYSDSFDIDHHPIADWQRATLVELMDRLDMSPDTEWHYIATTHGAIFSMYDLRQKYQRLTCNAIDAIHGIAGLRWVESSQRKFEIALTRTIPVEPKPTWNSVTA